MLLWWAFAMTAVLLAPAAVLVSASLTGADPTLLIAAIVIGVLAAAVQFLGLIRWPFLVPYLARTSADPATTPAQRDAIDIVFQSFHRYLGVAVGEHLGYLLSGTWTILVGIAITQSTAVPAWIGVIGIVVGATLALCAFEFVGRFEEHGWTFAARVTPVAYIAWSIWLAGTGVALVV